MRAFAAYRTFVLTAAWTAAMLLAHGAAATTGANFTLPLRPTPQAGGLSLSVDCRWAQGYGYRPVRFELQCQPAAASDRTLTVEVGFSGYYRNRPTVTASTQLRIPAGSTQVAHVMSVPQLAYTDSMALSVSEDGREIEALSSNYQPMTSAVSWSDVTLPRVLFVSDGTIDLTQFAFLDSFIEQNPGTVRPADVAAFDQQSKDSLVEGWVNYSCLDLVFISLEDVQDLAMGRPGVWQALRTWTHSGGNLCVYGVGRDWHALAELEGLLGCQASAAEAADALRGWQPPSKDVFETTIVAAVIAAQQEVDPSNPPPTVATPADDPFAWRAAGLGRVVAWPAAQPFPGEEATWRWLMETLGPTRTFWATRHGTSPDEDNPYFNDFLIADAGLPPIRAYQVLISVFVVTIGPLNYWLLRRRRRLHLFLFTVPLAALAVSVALVLYALASDGLESRVRARSLTFLDQRDGQAVRLARLSYYLGLAPAGGMTFSDDMIVMPLELNTRGRNPAPRQMVWAGEQHLTRGWLNARTPTQYITTRCDRTQQNLQVTSESQGAQPATIVENHLGVPILRLMICDESGQLHQATEPIALDERTALAALTPPTERDALTAFADELLKDRPEFPEGLTGGESYSGFFFSRSFYSSYQSYMAHNTEDTLLESEIVRLMSDLRAHNLRPRSYVAIVARPAEIELGIDDASESQSRHIIYGIW